MKAIAIGVEERELTTPSTHEKDVSHVRCKQPKKKKYYATSKNYFMMDAQNSSKTNNLNSLKPNIRLKGHQYNLAVVQLDLKVDIQANH
jgi:hypothetical protein